MKSFEDLKAYKINGNYELDASFFEHADLFIHDANNSIEERAFIVRKMDIAYGMEVSSGTDEEIVEGYLADCDPDAPFTFKQPDHIGLWLVNMKSGDGWYAAKVFKGKSSPTSTTLCFHIPGNTKTFSCIDYDEWLPISRPD